MCLDASHTNGVQEAGRSNRPTRTKKSSQTERFEDFFFAYRLNFKDEGKERFRKLDRDRDMDSIWGKHGMDIITGQAYSDQQKCERKCKTQIDLINKE